MDNTQKIKKNSDAKIKANNKYSKSHYKNINIKIKPGEADYIKQVADKLNLSTAKLIVNAVKEYDRINDKVNND